MGMLLQKVGELLKKLLFLVTGVFVFMGLVPALAFMFALEFQVLSFVLSLLGVPDNLIQTTVLWIGCLLSALIAARLIWRVWPDKKQARNSDVR